MIVLDTNQIMISSVFAMFGKKMDSLTINDIRRAVMKGIIYYRERFSDDYGDMVLCYDTNNYWRTKMFPHYKAMRKSKQKTSDIDWNKLYGLFDIVKKEIRDNLPFINLEVPTMEADDVISVICHYKEDEKILIVSSDKDFQQLQKMGHVYQYSPSHRDMLVCEDPKSYLLEHIIRGDSSDGIPNVLSDGDTFICEDKKQTIMNKKRFNNILEKVNDGSIYNEDCEFKSNYERNENLIDLSRVPEDKKDNVINAYEAQVEVFDRDTDFMGYFKSNGMYDLLEDVNNIKRKLDV